VKWTRLQLLEKRSGIYRILTVAGVCKVMPVHISWQQADFSKKNGKHEN
jgi:hypothetical protein